ncbi:MAG: PduL/EutD family phosphate acyltransferase, partial [Clostridia bacterium]
MKKIIVETSARHVHVTRETLDTLYGKGWELNVKKMLSQPGQFVCNEKVEVAGPKSSIKNISILGPIRKANQVELSLTDARTIGVSAPVRQSGDIAGSAAIKIIGPCGEVEISEGCIAAQRHIHLTPSDAIDMGLADK